MSSMARRYEVYTGEDDYEVVSGFAYRDEEVTIAVMGATGSGKTTFINTVSGSHLAVGDGLKSCTNSVELSQSFMLAGRTVRLIDTPGFDDTNLSDTDILVMIGASLSKMYEEGHKLSGVIYMHRISDFKMTGMSRRNFSMFRKLCGDDTLRNVIIVTNMWSEVNAERGLAREDELATDDMFFKPVLDKGARMMRHDNSYQTAADILSQLVPNRRQTLLIQRELVDEDKDIAETTAGAELARDLEEQTRKYRETVRQLALEHEEALLAEDIETVRELEEERQQAEIKVETIEKKKRDFSGTWAVLATVATSVAAAGLMYMATGRVSISRSRSPSPSLK